LFVAGALTDVTLAPVRLAWTRVELMGDVAVRLTPLAREDAAEMIRSLKTYPLLAGFRSQ